MEQLGATWFKTPVAAWLVLLVTGTGVRNFDDYVKSVAKPAGLNIKRHEAIRDKHQPSNPRPPRNRRQRRPRRKRRSGDIHFPRWSCVVISNCWWDTSKAGLANLEHEAPELT